MVSYMHIVATSIPLGLCDAHVYNLSVKIE
jgi:hypothetical protein